jgi:cation diffusion facilitator family transporter
VAIWGIAISLFLGVLKLLGGFLGHSFALLSDSVHSLGDALTSSALLGALMLAQRPPDREHPYGHTRAETAAGSSTALLLVLSALWLGWQSLATINQEFVRPEPYTLAIALFSGILKEALYHYNRRAAKRTGSTALLASAWDHRLDALTSLAVFAGVALATWGGPAYHWADHGAAILVAAVILVVGGRLFWGNLQEMMDRQADPDMLSTVRQEALAVPRVKGVEKLLIRKTGLEYLVDMHLEVDPEMTVLESHAIAHVVKDRVRQRVPLIKDVLIHIEPAK